MSEEKDLEKIFTDNHVDLDMALSAADKVTEFLDKSLREPFERYMVARLVSILYEETLECSLKPELETRIRNLANQKSKSHT